MRSTQMCPKCSGQKFAVTDDFRQTDYDTVFPKAPLEFFAVTVPLQDHRNRSFGLHWRGGTGHFETWMCLGCGYTEFYAHGLEHIEEIAERWPDRVRIVDAGPGPQGPYR